MEESESISLNPRDAGRFLSEKAEQVGYIFTWIMYAMLKTLESSIAYRQSISRSLVRIAKESISDDLRVELGKMPTKVSGKSLLHTTHKF